MLSHSFILLAILSITYGRSTANVLSFSNVVETTGLGLEASLQLKTGPNQDSEDDISTNGTNEDDNSTNGTNEDGNTNHDKKIEDSVEKMLIDFKTDNDSRFNNLTSVLGRVLAEVKTLKTDLGKTTASIKTSNAEIKTLKTELGKNTASIKTLNAECEKYTFKATTTKLTFDEAREECIRMGGHLLQDNLGPKGSKYHDEIRQLATLYTVIGTHDGMWIGYTDRESEGTWRFLNGELYDAHNRGQSSVAYWDNLDNAGNSEHCAHLWKAGGPLTLNDNNCGVRMNGLCEMTRNCLAITTNDN